MIHFHKLRRWLNTKLPNLNRYLYLQEALPRPGHLASSLLSLPAFLCSNFKNVTFPSLFSLLWILAKKRLSSHFRPCHSLFKDPSTQHNAAACRHALPHLLAFLDLNEKAWLLLLLSPPLGSFRDFCYCCFLFLKPLSVLELCRRGWPQTHKVCSTTPS